MIQRDPYLSTSALIIYWVIAVPLSFTSSAEAFVSPCRIHEMTLVQPHLRQQAPSLRLVSFLNRISLNLMRSNRVASQLWVVPLADDENGKKTNGDDDDDDNLDWFKMGQQMAKELRNEAEDMQEDVEEMNDTNNENDSGGEEETVETDNAIATQEEVKGPSIAIVEAQVLSLETARALIASAACICQMKEEELKAVQADIQRLREKLNKLDEKEVLLEEECALARSNQDQTIEQERIVRKTFVNLANQSEETIN